MSNSEQGISQVQLAAARADASQDGGLDKHHGRGVAHLDERIFFYLLVLAFLGFFVVWITASSALVLYGSLGLALLLLFLWGFVRIRRIRRIENERAAQVQAMQPED